MDGAHQPEIGKRGAVARAQGDSQQGERQQQQRQDEVDRGAGDRDQKLLSRFAGHALQLGQAADGQQRDIRHIHAEILCREGVPEFVQNDAEEKQEDDDDAVYRADNFVARALTENIGAVEENQDKRPMDLNVDTANAGDLQCATHLHASNHWLFQPAFVPAIPPATLSCRTTPAARPGCTLGMDRMPAKRRNRKFRCRVRRTR